MFRAIIKDNWLTCPGTITRDFPTYKEAKWFIENEMAAAKDLFSDNDNLSAIIRKV